MIVQGSLFAAEQTAESKDDWWTPRWVFETLGVEFDVDVASPPGGIPYIRARRFLTMADDGLATPWEGNVWMNPPYSRMTPWVNRFMDHRNGIALLPFARSAWCNRIWESDAAIVVLPADLKFTRRGEPMGMAFNVALFAFGVENQQALTRIGRVR